MKTNQTNFKHGFSFWFKRILAGLLILIVLSVATIFAGGAIVRAQARANYPPPGQLVDVGGYKLHIHCVGEGSPTVVLLSGSAVQSPYWWIVQNKAANTTRVCAYDRAGYAWSEEGTDDLSPRGQVEDLKALLSNAGIEPPYVLAGHSYGGYIARLYAQTYSDEVVGLVMIDSSHEEQFVRFPEEIQARGRRMFTGPNSPVRVFLVGLLGSLQALLPTGRHEAEKYLPSDVVETVYALRKLHPYMLLTIKAEVSEMVLGQSPRVTDLGNLPMIVISHGIPTPATDQTEEVNAEYEQLHREMQKELLAISTQSRQMIAEESNHDEIPLKQADLVVQAIQDVMTQAVASR
ncbi:MAG TPA: alpha/beta fold hydrolase [Anaerolineales bacterium]|nr:alpha/beta fold hydrolase [Anaerolineales bacterium]